MTETSAKSVPVAAMISDFTYGTSDGPNLDQRPITVQTLFSSYSIRPGMMSERAYFFKTSAIQSTAARLGNKKMNQNSRNLIWRFRSLGYDTVWICRLFPTFRKSMFLPSWVMKGWIYIATAARTSYLPKPFFPLTSQVTVLYLAVMD
jgi:hypothetical protein